MSKLDFIPQKETIVTVPHFFPSDSLVCVAEEDAMVILMNEDRVVYELNLQSWKLEDSILATAEGINSPYRPHCDSGYQVSRNGSRFVGFYVRCPNWSEITTRAHAEEHSAAVDIGKARLELNIFDLSGTADQVQTIELEFAVPEYRRSHKHAIEFSPDLSIVRAHAQIFDLTAPGYPSLSFVDNALDKLQEVEYQKITFSSCNRYLVLTKNGHRIAANEPTAYGVFRIYRTDGKIEKIAIPGLDNVVADGFSAAFHPEVPLFVLTCFTRPEPSVWNAANYINAIEIDLEALKTSPIDIPEYKLPGFPM